MVSTLAPGGVLQGNALVGELPQNYPAGNLFPAWGSTVFSNPAAGDYSLPANSPLRGAATDGTDIGVNWQTLVQKTSGVR
jgi:hypothetical protein